MEQVRFVCLDGEISEEFYKLAAEYLPRSKESKMKEREKRFSRAFIAAMLEGQVIGVCFGWDRKPDAPEDDSFELNGIAIKEPFQKKGYGKLLLKAFIKAASEYGFSVISVGSAGGYVEKFYIDCGFVPKEYKIWEGGLPKVVKTFDGIADYQTYVRPNADGFVVMEIKCNNSHYDSV